MLQIDKYNGNPIGVRLPPHVELTVEFTEPGVKGDTAGAANKPARMDTGLEVRVPMFIKEGEKIKVHTETREFCGACVMHLDLQSQRVLGALMEKEMTTPDLYPLTVNALIAASNQRSSRDPVMDPYREDEVRTALHRLQDLELVAPARDSGRAARYEHRIRTVSAASA